MRLVVRIRGGPCPLSAPPAPIGASGQIGRGQRGGLLFLVDPRSVVVESLVLSVVEIVVRGRNSAVVQLRRPRGPPVSREGVVVDRLGRTLLTGSEVAPLSLCAVVVVGARNRPRNVVGIYLSQGFISGTRNSLCRSTPRFVHPPSLT